MDKIHHVELIQISNDSQKIIERAGRTCYRSFDKVKEGSDERLIKSLIRMDHGSVLEHAMATFRIEGVSRSLTHQLVRHRPASFSQQSQRYVNEYNATFVVPPKIAENEGALRVYSDINEAILEAYTKLRGMGIPKEDARYLLPNSTATEIVVSANFRQWRHMIKERTTIGAQWEIRRVMIDVLEILTEHAPAVFGDFIIDYDNHTAHPTYYKK